MDAACELTNPEAFGLLFALLMLVLMGAALGLAVGVSVGRDQEYRRRQEALYKSAFAGEVYEHGRL